MRNPLLYKLGMNGSCFSLPIFGCWILYAIFHACLIYVFDFLTLSQEDCISSNGQIQGFWVSGHIVYGACVFVANILLILRFNTHTAQSLFLFFLMFSAYFVVVLLQA